MAKVKWEYKVVEFGLISAQQKEAALNLLGAQLWEVCGQTSYIGPGGGIFSVYTLKREI